MSLPYLEISNFLSDFDSARNYFDSIPYEGVTNPADGVYYPGVSTEIPSNIASEVIDKTSSIIGREVLPRTIFVRLSTEGVEAPHQAHTDSVMGQYSLMCYLNRSNDCRGGTAFVKSVHGLYSDPEAVEDFEFWKENHSNPDLWVAWARCDMEENKACIFPANLMHRAEPIGGFGKTAKDGRLVLTMFFDVVN